MMTVRVSKGRIGRILGGGYTGWDGMERNGTERVGYGLVLWICIIFSCWNGNHQDYGDELSVSSVSLYQRIRMHEH